ncbi:hypothetical protein K450DRAFT_236793 [Umbelopsis ramanniana AG]|uniref:Uncharacterized protein n=1 Tax=Umbelopsis ramanniana AG TaxID=1314678 RepID=A0AAD5HF32_UMBRA|nr:uncharacterized protein K450DRAFT_236793 [Umbelopsis ramanniana AG]KAI8580679.1 hypothetical protein K450DRAFT_236793 [Umbelopsis ramanniana AG]
MKMLLRHMFYFILRASGCLSISIGRSHCVSLTTGSNFLSVSSLFTFFILINHLV